jgi:hypothetical protein
MPQQGQCAVGRRARERALDGSLAFTDLPRGRELVPFVFTDAAGRDLGEQRVLPEVFLEVPEDAPVLGYRPLPRLRGQVAFDGLIERDAGALRLLGLDLQ